MIGSILASALVVATPLSIIGCSNKADEINYSFYGHESVYELNDNFSIVGLKLKLVKQDGKTEEVVVTQDMIKQMPDMSTVGKKQITIVYDGFALIMVHIKTFPVSMQIILYCCPMTPFMTFFNGMIFNVIIDVTCIIIFIVQIIVYYSASLLVLKRKIRR